VVPSYQSEATIAGCLDALRLQDATFDFEAIVVDSGTDATAEIVRRQYHEIAVIHLGQRVGPEAARNEGARHARGRLLAFIDSDCVAAPDWLRRLVDRIDEGYDAIGGATANGNPQSMVSWAGYICEFREFLPQGSIRPMPYLSPNTVAYPADVFWSVGGFPVGYYPMEDQVFHKPLRERGARIALDPEIVVAHTHRVTRADFLSHQWRLGEANVRALKATGARGAWMTTKPVVATLAVLALIPYRFVRTVIACRTVGGGLLLRNWRLQWLCWLGMCWWAAGFARGTRQAARSQRS
jgi:glycosyltransferase involved in cell wall biosynthesis